MRCYRLALLLLIAASPALSQTAPSPMQIPSELTDPYMTDRLVKMSQALSDALLNLPAGEIEAAAEGRQPTWADRHRTLRDIARRDDPNFDRRLQRGVAEAGPQLQAAQRAIVTTLPKVAGALSQAAGEIHRALQNMPRPDYPNP